MNLFLFVFMLSLPWNWQYLSTAMKVKTWCHCAAPAGYPERIGWYDGEIHIVHCGFDVETNRRYIHELTHYLADYYGLTKYDWADFVSVVRTESLGWNDQRRASVENMIAYGGGAELHADLPNILVGDIPRSLQPWYPWFDLTPTSKAKSRVATP